ncbi:MAG: tryptophan 2,3-dioxygenase [Deltaproteobacteria bacterium]|nr:tryptophan 2,3-dioxygenase [Deltaproteobacteria bacterium]
MSETQNPSPKTSVDIEGQDIHWDPNLSYGSYLHIDELLQCQTPITEQHDEMMFIVIHQSAELWMKCCLHEMRAAMACVKNDDLGTAFKMLARVARIQLQLEQSWDILSTMTPADYASFRNDLGNASGFQSHQYRALEYAFGNKNAKMAEVHKQKPERYEYLQSVLKAPSFYDLCLQLLKKRGFDIPDSHLDRDFSLPYEANEKVEDAWLEVYQNTEKYWDLYALAEKLVDLEHRFHAWRFSHMKTVERIIGYKRGTGGTGGVSYLVKALDLRFFPELWTLRTRI